MKISYLESAADFLQRAGAWLQQREVEHQLLLGIAGNVARRAVTGEGTDVPPERRPLFVLLEGDAGFLGAGLMTPPHRMVLTAMGEPPLRALAADLVKRNLNISGVVTDPRGAALFAEIYARGTRRRIAPGRSERLYELRPSGWRQPKPLPAGSMGRAEPKHLDVAARWVAAFMRDVRDTTPVSEAPTLAENAVKGGRLFFWKLDDQPLSMAAWARPSDRGIAVNSVYTPPELRCHGYATALVAQLSKYLLTPVEDGGMGKDFCSLYTDLANPTSNSIYQKMGYRPVCDLQELDFQA